MSGSWFAETALTQPRGDHRITRMMKASALVGKRPESMRFHAPLVPTIDQIMVEERANAFTKRSLKTSAKLAGLKMAVSMCDLTTLEGKDTPG